MEELIQKAMEAREKAYAPYSGCIQDVILKMPAIRLLTAPSGRLFSRRSAKESGNLCGLPL